MGRQFFVAEVPDVSASDGHVRVDYGGDSFTMSPQVALRVADTVRQAAYMALRAPPAPHCTVVKFKRK